MSDLVRTLALPGPRPTLRSAWFPDSPHWHSVRVYLAGGADLSVVLARVVPAGGRVILAKTQVTPEIGFIALCIDSEGNRIGLHSQH